MNVVPTRLHGVMVAETEIRADLRGSFSRFFCEDDLRLAVANRHIVQINHSRTSQRGAIRGLHYQNEPFAETKFVRCLTGLVWDVAVDLRAGSPTFLQWHAVELSPENTLMMIVPEGCAHGFQALSPECELLYLHTARYAPEAEAGVTWNDPRIGILWPLPLPDQGGLSDRDRRLPTLAPDFAGVSA
jgi:dTDP-4-dehydrorhamnose 3,5-epimerase